MKFILFALFALFAVAAAVHWDRNGQYRLVEDHLSIVPTTFDYRVGYPYPYASPKIIVQNQTDTDEKVATRPANDRKDTKETKYKSSLEIDLLVEDNKILAEVG
ncbi:hypothetical protein ACJJTC_007429 [Scirpophaga incertulas]